MTGLDEDRSGNGEPRRGAEAGSMPFFPGPAGRRPGHRGTVPPPGTPPGTPLPAPHAAPVKPPDRAEPSDHAKPSDAAQSGEPQEPPGPTAPARPSGAAAPGNALPTTLRGSPSDVTMAVEGRITIEDEVIEKIAALAAMEVAGVAALVARPDPAVPGPYAGQAGTGVRAALDGDEVTLDLVIAVEYGSVIRDVAKAVKANVARVAGVMLGARVAAVNVAVGDVRKPPGARR